MPDASTHPDLADDEAQRARERLARAGILASTPATRARPDPELLTRARAAAGRGTPLADSVTRPRLTSFADRPVSVEPYATRPGSGAPADMEAEGSSRSSALRRSQHRADRLDMTICVRSTPAGIATIRRRAEAAGLEPTAHIRRVALAADGQATG